MKNKILTVLLVVVMLVPTVIAIVNYSKQQNGTADVHNTTSAKITDTKGYSYSVTREDDSEFLTYLLSAVGNSTSIGSLPTTVEMGDFYQIVFNTAAREQGYKFYFSNSGDDCYFVDANGNAYKMSAEDGNTFLSSTYAAALYENGIPPILSVSGTQVVPDTLKWAFTDYAGNKVNASASAFIKNEVEDITAEGGLAMEFDVQPDSLTVKIKDFESGAVLFDDEYTNIGSLDMSKSEKVTVSASAKWFEDESRTYSGEITYCFNSSVSAVAEFFAGATELEIGEFICVTGKNIGNADNIVFSSTPDIAYTPVFFKDGEDYQALIPFNWDLEAGDYALNFEYGGTTQIINIKLNARTNPFRNATVTIADAVVNSYGSDEIYNKCKDTLTEVAKSKDKADKRYFDGEFITGVGDATIVGGFGHTYTVTGKSISYRHTGVDYKLDADTEIKAVNAGVVVYAGYLDYSGYTVVIEHGYGLKSWYCHMSKTAVEVGTEVKKSDTVGYAGSSGFFSTTGVHVGLSVFDTPVCQYALWSDGAFKCVPIYKG